MKNQTHTGSRLTAVDTLRGIVIVLMALDHARGFFGKTGFDYTDLNQTEPLLFATRWVTHFCAPVFVFLAGTSAFLYLQKEDRTHRDLTRFLVTRGLWLVFLELTVVNLSWGLVLHQGLMLLQVIWVIGWSMICLAGLIHLPRSVGWALCLGMVLLHNSLDSVQAGSLGAWALPWAFLHQFYFFKIGDNLSALIVYPLIPWAGVMGLGYLSGSLFLEPPDQRRKKLIQIGAALLWGFLVVRALNIYGDPQPWTAQGRGILFSLFSFLNVTKYPPSLSFLLMTMGPSLILLTMLDSLPASLTRVCNTFGRVPMFFYLLHLPFLCLAMHVWSYFSFGRMDGWWDGPLSQYPEAYQFTLWRVYAAWLLVVAALYPLCVWFVGVKRRRKDWWLSYL